MMFDRYQYILNAIGTTMRISSTMKKLCRPIITMDQDKRSITFLIFLYALQSVPVGLAASTSLLLQSKVIGYQNQALFSIVFWPFSFKIVWAPIVDAVFNRKLGRRKSWIVPVQYLLGILLLVLSLYVNDLVGETLPDNAIAQIHPVVLKNGHSFQSHDSLVKKEVLDARKSRNEMVLPRRKLLLNEESLLTKQTPEIDKKNAFLKIYKKFLKKDVESSLGRSENTNKEVKKSGTVHVLTLTLVFLLMIFLSATQDICVDGWALNMLSRENIGWASTCNAVGPAIGFSLGSPVLLALESVSFCNKYLRYTPSNHGLVTLPGYLYFWGLVYLISTTLILIFAKETSSTDLVKDCSVRENVKQAYRKLYSVLQLKPVKELAFIYLTAKVGFSTVDYVTGLKFVEHGLPKEKLALLSVPMIPVQVLLPLYISRYTVGPRPMDLYIKAYPYRLLLNFVFPFALWLTTYVSYNSSPGGEFPNYYYLIMVALYGLQQIGIYSMAVARTSLNARISDPSIGGSYMSLLTTFSNLGNAWPGTLMLFFVDLVPFFTCNSVDAEHICPENKVCPSTCITVLDGYHVECLLCLLIGFLWLRFMTKRILRLQSLPLDAWTCQIKGIRY